MPNEAADVLADHADLRFLQPQMQRGDILHHVRRLGALVDGQPRLGGIPVGDHRARLQGHAGVAAEHEIRLDDLIATRRTPCRRRRHRAGARTQIVAERGMNDGGLRIERGAHVDHRLEFLVVDHDGFRRVFRRGPAGGDDGRRPLRPASRHGRWRWRAAAPIEALQMRQHADPGGDDISQFRTGDHRDDRPAFVWPRRRRCG